VPAELSFLAHALFCPALLCTWCSESEPLLFRSTRQILSADPFYAEEIIRAVTQMPGFRLLHLLPSEHGNGFLGDPADSPGATNTVSGDQEKGSSDASGQTSKKRRQRRDGGEDQDGMRKKKDDDKNGEGTPELKKRNTEACERWARPYSLVYPQMLEINKFSTCRPPGSLTERSEWRYVPS
jgi:hypothetical protein